MPAPDRKAEARDIRLLITRPEADAAVLKARLIALGHEPLVEPLLDVALLPVAPEDIDGAQALIATSKNGLRAVARSAAFDIARELPVYVVGPGTSSTAKALGFRIVVQGPKSAKELVQVVTGTADINGPALVHLAGEALAYDVAGELQRLGFHVLQPVVYRTVAVRELTQGMQTRIGRGELDGVILLSPQTAVVYARLVQKHGLAEGCRRSTHYCFSAAVATALSSLGKIVTAVPELPNLESLLALIGPGAAQSR